MIGANPILPLINLYKGLVEKIVFVGYLDQSYFKNNFNNLLTNNKK